MRNILILCTGNSARSILAEGLITALGAGRFQGYSAGSHPKDAPHPLALETLAANGHNAEGYQSKSWDVFAASHAPTMHAVITVCDSAAGEVCPIWPGAPVQAHWGVPDPAAAEGDDDERRWAFAVTYQRLRGRVEAMLALPDAAWDSPDLAVRLNTIGADHAAAESDKAT